VGASRYEALLCLYLYSVIQKPVHVRFDLILHAWSAKFFMVKRCTLRCLACYVMLSRLVRFVYGGMVRKVFSCRAMSSA
jgi:hypothetical protein